MNVDELLKSPIQVVNIGLASFARELDKRGVACVHVDWSPPAVVNPRIRDLLAKLGS